jgi:predicted esterase
MNVAEHHLRVARRARYYTIGSGVDADDIWVVCHGYGQLAARFIHNFTVIARAGRLMVAPEALHRFYLDAPPKPAAERRVGATWMTREDRENDIADYVDYLDTLVSELLAQAPQARLRVLGFSQGTATVLRWAVHASRVPKQLILWAGEVPGDVDWNAAGRKLAATRIDVVRGDQDQSITQPLLERNLRAFDEVQLSYHLHSFSGGHHLDDEMLRRLASL